MLFLSYTDTINAFFFSLKGQIFSSYLELEKTKVFQTIICKPFSTTALVVAATVIPNFQPS